MCIAKSAQSGLEPKLKTCNSKIAERKHLGNCFISLGNLSYQKPKLDKWANWMLCTEKGTMIREEPCLCRPKPEKRRHLQDTHFLKMWRNPHISKPGQQPSFNKALLMKFYKCQWETETFVKQWVSFWNFLYIFVFCSYTQKF